MNKYICCLIAKIFLLHSAAFCFAAGGDLVWEFTTNHYVESSPAVYEGYVYIGSDDSKLYCLAAATGETIWTHDAYWVRSSPVVVNGFVYFMGSSGLRCLNAHTGEQIWETKMDSWGKDQSPAFLNGYVYTTSDNNAFCLDANTGEIIWETYIPDAENTAAVDGSNFYVPHYDTELSLPIISSLNIKNGNTIWEFKQIQNKSSGKLSAPAISDGYVFTSHQRLGKIFCLSAETGKVVWEFKSEEGECSAPVVSDGSVFFGCTDLLYRLDALTGNKIWEFIGEKNFHIHTSPIVTDKFIYIAIDHKIYCFDAVTGEEQWYFSAGNNIVSTPALSEGYLYFGSYDKKVYCIEAADGDNGSWPMYRYNPKKTASRGCSNDADCDGFSDSNDNCPEVYNTDQLDTDGDGTGDLCDDETQELSVTPLNRDVDDSAGTTSFSVDNVGVRYMYWYTDIISGEEWMSIVSGETGADTGTITLSFTENSNKSPRIGTIRITAPAAPNSPQDVTITQYGLRENSFISCETASDTISINQRFKAYGTLTKQNETPIQDALVEVIYTAPDETTTKEITITNQDGYYEVEIIPDQTGTWEVQSFFGGNDDFAVSQSESIQVTVSSSADMPDQKAIIVAGGGQYDGNTLWDSTQLCTNYAWQVLISQGFTNDTIYYLSSNMNLDIDSDGIVDVDADATNTNLQYALTQWSQDADDIVLYITDHGDDGKFRMGEDEILKAENLNRWLDEIQDTINGKVVFVYDACQSGSFTPYLKPSRGNDRILVCSTSADEEAYFLDNGVISFSHYFWGEIFKGNTVYDSYVTAKNAMSLHGFQNAVLDDDGNGKANEKSDGFLAKGFYIGLGVVTAEDIPTIGEICPEQILEGQTDAEIWVSDVTTAGTIDRVWAIITAPDFNHSDTSIPVTYLPTVDLADNGNGRYEGIYTGFTNIGAYLITIYAATTDGNVSIPVETTVHQLQGESTSPDESCPLETFYKDNPQRLEQIRNFRDKLLSKTKTGQHLIKKYYSFVKWINSL